MTVVPYGNRRAKLSALDKETVLAMFFNGEANQVIADRVKCTVSHVYSLTKRFRPLSPSRPRNHPRLVQQRTRP